MDNIKKYSIGAVSETCKVPIKALRYYDKIGLVQPRFRDENTNYRYYAKEQMITIYIIKKLRMLGLSLKEVQEIYAVNNIAHLENNIIKKLKNISSEIKELQTKYEDGEYLLKRIHNGQSILSHKKDHGSERLEVKIEMIEEKHVIAIRKVMRKYHSEEVHIGIWVELIELLRKEKCIMKGPISATFYPTRLLGQFLVEDCDLELSVEVDKCKDSPEYRLCPKFEAATAYYVGPYSNIMQAHINMIKWINENNYKIIGPTTEENIISPIDVENEDEHVTKIIMPIQKNLEN